MIITENRVLDEERALYGSKDILVRACSFDGPADGESALKECRNVEIESSHFNLRYPFWHCSSIKIKDSEMTENCRAALWYSKDIVIENTKLHGIKALRECENIHIENGSIISPEFGWFSKDIEMKNTTAEAEYFMMRCQKLRFENVELKGKYSFQYIKNATFENCNFDTKDAFWHAENVVVKNSVIKGEYLGWYCKNVTFENCSISGTQPLCYCENLKLINCKMEGADFSFEKSDVEATIVTPVISIKNPKSGTITVPSVEQIIMDEESAKGKVVVKG